MNFTDMGIAILQRSQDGNLLTPLDLKLVEMGLNGRLNEAGDAAFTALHAQVADGSYFREPHWFRGIEHMTRDHQGYVYWKGQSVEHYSFTDAAAELAAAQELARRCLRLELIGIPVNGSTVLREACYEAPADTPWKLAAQRCYSFFGKDGQVAGIFYRLKNDRVFSIRLREGRVEVLGYQNAYRAFHAFQDAGWASLGAHPSYAELEARLQRLGVSPERLDSELRGDWAH